MDEIIFGHRKNLLAAEKITFATEIILFGAGGIDPVTEKINFTTQ